MYHYLHMAQGNYRGFLKGEVVRLKKYLYMLRPLLACLWIEKHGSTPPTEFAKLVADAGLSVTRIAAIDELLVRKMSGDELDTSAKIPELNDFIQQMLEKYSLLSCTRPTPVTDFALLDQLFREMLHELWSTEPRSEIVDFCPKET